jgi:hypothetical protein
LDDAPKWKLAVPQAILKWSLKITRRASHFQQYPDSTMVKSLALYRKKLTEKGIRAILNGRLRWYRRTTAHSLFLLKNWCVGRFVELSGNKIRLDEITLLVDNPLIKTVDKGPMFFGVYERGERNLTRRYVDPARPTIEIGGSIGGVACITNPPYSAGR